LYRIKWREKLTKKTILAFYTAHVLLLVFLTYNKTAFIFFVPFPESWCSSVCWEKKFLISFYGDPGQRSSALAEGLGGEETVIFIVRESNSWENKPWEQPIPITMVSAQAVAWRWKSCNLSILLTGPNLFRHVLKFISPIIYWFLLCMKCTIASLHVTLSTTEGDNMFTNFLSLVSETEQI